mmetsp:Transcript_36418/g.81041  ORF Transcript_36418/g.81041 Transcript_36418/m.81041 type:complete len:359 (-) Transcript_36418:1953-3029(-)
MHVGQCSQHVCMRKFSMQMQVIPCSYHSGSCCPRLGVQHLSCSPNPVASLLPLLLSTAGCTEQRSCAAVRSWQDGSHGATQLQSCNSYAGACSVLSISRSDTSCITSSCCLNSAASRPVPRDTSQCPRLLSPPADRAASRSCCTQPAARARSDICGTTSWSPAPAAPSRSHACSASPGKSSRIVQASGPPPLVLPLRLNDPERRMAVAAMAAACCTLPGASSMGSRAVVGDMLPLRGDTLPDVPLSPYRRASSDPSSSSSMRLRLKQQPACSACSTSSHTVAASAACTAPGPLLLPLAASPAAGGPRYSAADAAAAVLRATDSSVMPARQAQQMRVRGIRRTWERCSAHRRGVLSVAS